MTITTPPNYKRKTIFVCQPKINIIDLISSTNLHDSNIQKKINTHNKSNILLKNLTRNKEITVQKNMKEKLKEKVNQNTNLHDFGFQNIKQKMKELSKINLQHTSYQQIIKLKEMFLRKRTRWRHTSQTQRKSHTCFYLNINRLDTTIHKVAQLYMDLHSLGVSIICLSETNLHWKRNHLTQQFKYILKKA